MDNLRSIEGNLNPVARATGYFKILLSPIPFTEWPAIINAVGYFWLIARVQANGSQYPKFTMGNRSFAW